MAEKLIKIDELREVMYNVTSMNITYGKACEQISQICRDRALIIDSVSFSEAKICEPLIIKGHCTNCNKDFDISNIHKCYEQN